MIRRKPPHLQLVAIDGQNKAGTCHHSGQSLPLVASIAPEPIELLTLRLLRYTCTSLAHETTRGWEQAHHVAEAALGFADGPSFVAHVVALLRAVRAERNTGFSYSAADCPTCCQRMTDEERQIILLLRAARRSELQEVGLLAARLAVAEHAPRIALAAHALGVRLAAWALTTELTSLPVTPHEAEHIANPALRLPPGIHHVD